jgi:GH35 family endo-1,4-beta-xylanase
MSGHAWWIVLLACGVAVSAEAQMLDAPWVARADQRMVQSRQADVRVIVLGRDDKPVSGATVRFRMVQHAFPFGVRLNPAEFRDGAQPPAARDAMPVWRCFNAASLDLATAWVVTQPHQGQWDFLVIDDMISWADGRGMRLRWGALTSADPGRVPQWLLRLHGADMEAALRDHVRTVMVRFGHRVDQFDVHTDQFDHNLVSARLGQTMVRRLHEYAKASAPDAATCLRFEDGLSGERLNTMVQQVTTMRQDFVPFDLVAVDQRFGGMIVQGPLQRGLESLGNLGVGVVVTNLEVGGPTPAAAAINLETVLRTLMAERAVRGIWFAGVRGDEFADPNAALLDDEGNPTPAGQVLDGLVRQRWWTDVEAQADELGNVRLHVFAGVYHLSAQTPSGLAETTVYLPVADEQRVVLLRPLAPLEAVGD